jgi:polyisoprenoid-binding protein YceI
VNTRFASFAAFLGLSFAGVTLAPAAQYKIDPVHSQVVYKINHLGVSNQWGRFNSVEGSFNTDDGKENFQATVKVESLDTGNKKRDDHVKSADFFNAKQFPEITFKSTGVKKTGENAYEVTGDLAIHGVTKSISVPVTKVGEAKTPMGDRAGLEGSFTLKRSDYGMTGMQGPVGDEVTLFVNVEGTKE